MFNYRKLIAISEGAASADSHSAIILAPYGTIAETIEDVSGAIEQTSSDISNMNMMGDQASLRNTVDVVADGVENGKDPEMINATVTRIHESVFGSIWEAIKKFFQKIISWVKGIIEKIKIKLGLLSSDRDKFLAAVEKAITAKSGKVIDPEFQWEGHKWDKKFVANPVDVFKNSEYIKMGEGMVEKGNDYLSKMDFNKFIDEGRKVDITTIKEEEEEMSKENEESLEKLNEDLEDLMGGSEKLTNTISDYSFDTMKQFIKNSFKATEEIKKTYEKVKNNMDKLYNNVKKKADSFEKENLRRSSDYSKLSEKQRMNPNKGQTSLIARRDTSISKSYGYDASNSDIAMQMRHTLNIMQKGVNYGINMINKYSSGYQTIMNTCTKEFMFGIRKYISNLK